MLLRIAIAILELQLLGICDGVAKQPRPTLGAVSELKTGRDARGILTGDFNGDGLMDIATYSANQILVHFQQRDTTKWRTLPFRLEDGIVEILSGRFNGDRLSDLLIVTQTPPELVVYLANPDDKFVQRWRTSLGQSFEHIVAADVNSDGKTDLLLFGKKEPGITVYLGNNNGTFHPPTTILTDYTFSALAVEDVNADGVNDILAINWISNEVLVFSGFGRMRFSNPSTLLFESEPGQIGTALVDSGFTKDLVVGIPESKTIQTFSGNGFGAFSHMQTFASRTTPDQILLADFDGDGLTDIAVFGKQERAIEIYPNGGGGTFGDPTQFSCGRSPRQVVVSADAANGQPDIAVLDNADSYVRLMSNSGAKTSKKNQMSYACGLGPAGVIVSDLDGDGQPDILVANEVSRSISAFFNRGEGLLQGQVSFPASAAVKSLNYCFRSDSSVKVIGRGAQRDTISVTDIHLPDLSHAAYSLATNGQSELLSATMDKSSTFLTISTLDLAELTHATTVARYQQISSSRFVEQSTSVPAANQVLCACIGDFDGDSTQDLVQLTINKRGKRIEAYEAKGLPSGEFLSPRFAFKMEAQDTLTASLWKADLNKDGIDDLVMLLKEPVFRLYTALGRRDTTFAQPVTDTTSTVDVASMDRLKFSDVNADGKLDIILDNSLTKTIQVYFGNGDGTFSPPVRLINSESVGGFAIEDINKDGVAELIVTDNVTGVLKIISLE